MATRKQIVARLVNGIAMELHEQRKAASEVIAVGNVVQTAQGAVS